MNRNNNQIGGNIDQLRQRINYLVSQAPTQISSITPRDIANITRASTDLAALNTLAQDLNLEIAKTKVKINSMLGVLRNSDLKKIIDTPVRLPNIPPQNTTSDLIALMEGLVQALDTYHQNRETNLPGLLTYIRGIVIPATVVDANLNSFLTELVDSTLNSVPEADRDAIKTALRTKGATVNPIITAWETTAQQAQQDAAAAGAVALAGLLDAQAIQGGPVQTGGKVVKLNLKFL